MGQIASLLLYHEMLNLEMMQQTLPIVFGTQWAITAYGQFTGDRIRRDSPKMEIGHFRMLIFNQLLDLIGWNLF